MNKKFADWELYMASKHVKNHFYLRDGYLPAPAPGPCQIQIQTIMRRQFGTFKSVQVCFHIVVIGNKVDVNWAPFHATHASIRW